MVVYNVLTPPARNDIPFVDVLLLWAIQCSSYVMKTRRTLRPVIKNVLDTSRTDASCAVALKELHHLFGPLLTGATGCALLPCVQAPFKSSKLLVLHQY